MQLELAGSVYKPSKKNELAVTNVLDKTEGKLLKRVVHHILV